MAAVATRIHDELVSRGIDVLLNDRDTRPGPKFKDADLIGIPIQVTVGKRGLKDGVVEIKDRASGDMVKMSVEDAIEETAGRVEQALSRVQT